MPIPVIQSSSHAKFYSIFLTKKHLLFDLIYNPAETAFLMEGKKLGAQIKNGFEMLELQAEESWRIWNK